MNYAELHKHLKEQVVFDRPIIDLGGGVCAHNFSFVSKNTHFLPDDHELKGSGDDLLDVADVCVPENSSFLYHVLHPKNEGKTRGMILLFHGFNEKHWHKYLPWAAKLLELTGKSVVLFPIAFHMNRAPLLWSDSRAMHKISRQRKEEFPDLLHSSLVNAAISARLHKNPQRFLWSGLQTFHDVKDFVGSCKNGEHPLFEEGVTSDIMAYSIGGFLSEVLLLSNPDGLFSETRLAMFCGGPVFNRISPVSKFILDSEANVRLYSYLVEHLESHLKHDRRLAECLDNSAGRAFRSMLNYKAMADFRERRFREMAGRISAIALAKDEVIPAYEVANTLQGRMRDIPVPVECMDFPYEYKHEEPFPVQNAPQEPVDAAFLSVMKKIAGVFS